MTTSALTADQKRLIDRHNPALNQANLATHLDNLTDDLRFRQAVAVLGTVSAETLGPPSFIDVPVQVNDADGVALTYAVNVRVRIFDDVGLATVATVGDHRLTQNGVTGIIHVDDQVDASYRTTTAGALVVRVEDVAGGSGDTIYAVVTDGGNESVRVVGGTFAVTFA